MSTADSQPNFFSTIYSSTGVGFYAAPFGTDYTGKTIHSTITDAVSCMQKCKFNLRCKLAVTTRSGLCLLKSNAGDAVSKPFYQGFFKT